MRGHYHIFTTPLGPCAIAWTERGISRVLLPPADGQQIAGDYVERRRPPAAVKAIVDRIVRHLEGQPQDFSDVAVDLDGISPFYRSVYEAARRLGSGEVCSYGELARSLGRPGAARAVGQALGRNPVPLIVPCHRIVAAGGKPGGFTAPRGLETKAALLGAEGYALARPRTLWDAGARDEAVAHLRKRDRRMRGVIDAVGPCRMARESETLFEALCESIIYQQLAGKAAAAITRRFMALFDGLPTAAALLALDEPVLRAAGLSNGKVRALRALATAVVEGTVDLARVPAMTDDEVSRHLTAVKGIGPWTVQMVLIFHLGRPDVFPPGDLGIRKAVQRLAGWDELPDAARMAPLAEKWAPWRSVATWYLWRSLGVQTMGDVPAPT